MLKLRSCCLKGRNISLQALLCSPQLLLQGRQRARAAGLAQQEGRGGGGEPRRLRHAGAPAQRALLPICRRIRQRRQEGCPAVAAALILQPGSQVSLSIHLLLLLPLPGQQPGRARLPLRVGAPPLRQEGLHARGLVGGGRARGG